MLRVVLGLLGCGLAWADPPAPEYWEWQTYPNPQINPKRCGGNTGWICDPNDILGPEEVDSLEAAAATLRANSTCACENRNLCVNIGAHGFTIAVAVLKRITVPPGEKPDRDDIKAFAENLRRSYKFGQCDDDILIAVATEDRLAWTDVGDGVKTLLTHRELDELFKLGRQHFANGQWASGLRRLISGYQGQLGDAETRRSGGGPGSWVWALIAVLLVLLCCVGVCVAGGGEVQKRRRKSQRDKEYRQVPTGAQPPKDSPDTGLVEMAEKESRRRQEEAPQKVKEEPPKREPSPPAGAGGAF